VEDKYIAQVIATLDHFGQRIFKNGLPQKMRPRMNGLTLPAVGSDINSVLDPHKGSVFAGSYLKSWWDGLSYIRGFQAINLVFE
jgi:hypothetical protein